MMIKSKIQLSGKSIDEIILQHSERGMDILQKLYPIEHCKEAVKAFSKLEEGAVFLYTGFYVGGFAETDGPIGSYCLARALKKLGYSPIIITDNFCENFFKEIESIDIPFNGYSEKEYEEIIKLHAPVCHISIERCGKNAQGKYANMRGVDIGEFTAPIDDLFAIGRKSAPAIAIGDGGNEIGMGNFKASIENDLSLIPCVINCDFPIIASVSNWGAYGFIAYLEKFYSQHVLPSFEEVDVYLDYIVSLGAVDGVKVENVRSVDGKDWQVEKEILADLRASIAGRHNSFTMSDTYDENSKSQVSIGIRLIEELDPIVEDNTSILDIGCGPGTLTNKINEKFAKRNIKVSGMDIDGIIITKANEAYPSIDFFVDNVFNDTRLTQYDYVFSNETMHWMPRIPAEYYTQDGVIYYFFGQLQKDRYREWGIFNFTKTMQFVDKKFTKNAVVQFGLDAQLYDIYKVINDTLVELFPENMQSIKFPLFYPELEEVENIIEHRTNMKIEKCVIESIELAETTKEEILGFVKGFSHNFLIGALGEDKLNKFYILLAKKIDDDIEKVRNNQWQHCMLTLSK